MNREIIRLFRITIPTIRLFSYQILPLKFLSLTSKLVILQLPYLIHNSTIKGKVKSIVISRIKMQVICGYQNAQTNRFHNFINLQIQVLFMIKGLYILKSIIFINLIKQEPNILWKPNPSFPAWLKNNLTKKCWLGFVGWSTDNIVIRFVHGKAIPTDFSHIKKNS